MSGILHGRALLLSCVAWSALLASPALAQNQPPAAGHDQPPAASPDSKGGSKGLGEIIVTAARQSQNLQKVSQSVSVVPGGKISQQGLGNIAQILDDIPSLQTTAQPQGYSINIRGQGGDGLPEGAVALEFDGVYSVNVLSTTIGFFDIDRVEVLPGPQSTRYGPSSDGGVVNIISKDPVMGSWDGNASATIGNYGLVRTELAQNIPITDKLALRVAGTTINRGSYFTPATSNNIGQAGRIKLLYKPNDDLTIGLKYEINHVGGTGIGYGISGGPPVMFSQVTAYLGDSINRNGKDPWHQGDTTTNGIADSDSHANLIQHSLGGNISYRINSAIAVDEIASWGKIVGTVNECSDSFGPGQVNSPHSCYLSHPDGPYRQFSNETRLHNTAGSKVKWNLGYYHYAYTYASYGPHDTTYGTQGFNNLVTDAFFGEVTYPVSDTFRLIAGARESLNSRKVNFGYNNGDPTPNFTKKFRHFDYRAGLEYDAAPASMVYATVSSGYRPGGLGSYTGTPGNYVAQSYSNEVTTSFELGSKNRFLDNRLQVNADIFYYIQKGIQDTDRYDGVTFNLNGATVACGNADAPGVVNSFFHVECQAPVLSLNAHEIGVEGQIIYKLTSDDQISFNATYLKATFDKNQTSCATLGLGTIPAGVCANGYTSPNLNDPQTPMYFNVNGLVEPHSPKFVATASYRHTFHFGGYDLSAGGGAFYTTGYYNSPVEIAYSFQPQYITGAVDVNFGPRQGRWTLSGYIRNVSDYAVKIATFPSTEIGDPRTYGATLKVNW